MRRDTVQRRAIRLRQIFEATGPSFAKLGQQLSMRADLLPYAYCAELGKMLDRVPPMPSPEAIAIVERNLKRPLGEVFEVFDPEPIGSARSRVCTKRSCTPASGSRSRFVVPASGRRSPPICGRSIGFLSLPKR